MRVTAVVAVLVVLGAITAVTLIGASINGLPGTVSFTPSAMRCGDTVVFDLRLPTYITGAVWELREGGVSGEVTSGSTQTPPMNDYYKVAPGHWRQETTVPMTSGCETAPLHRYGLVIRETGSGNVLAQTEVSITDGEGVVP